MQGEDHTLQVPSMQEGAGVDQCQRNVPDLFNGTHSYWDNEWLEADICHV